MKLRFVAYHLPLREGTSPGRALYALCEGLLADGHDVGVWSWWPLRPEQEMPSWWPERTGEDLPPWSYWRTVPPEPVRVTRLRAWWRPCTDVLRAGWRPPEDAVAVADDAESFAAVARSRRSVGTLHFLTVFDAPALRRFRRNDLNLYRAQARVARKARLVTGYSERVARRAGAHVVPVPIAYPVPGEWFTPSPQPIATLLADWSWSPNRKSLELLQSIWPDVRARVPGARLILAGRGLERMSISRGDGVEPIGPVPQVADVLSRSAVVAFPCPPTSGPKVKVLESLAYGIPVVTTAAGAEGIFGPPGAGTVVASMGTFAEKLAGLLVDPERRAQLGRAGREAVLAAHAPLPAARARIAAIRAAFGESPTAV